MHCKTSHSNVVLLQPPFVVCHLKVQVDLGGIPVYQWYGLNPECCMGPVSGFPSCSFIVVSNVSLKVNVLRDFEREV